MGYGLFRHADREDGIAPSAGTLYSLRERESTRKGTVTAPAPLQNLEKKIEPGLYTRIYGHVQGRLITLREDLVHTVSHRFDELALWFGAAAEPGGEQKIRFTPQVRERPEWKSSILPAVHSLIRDGRVSPAAVAPGEMAGVP
jgi:hypothetical protein